MRITFSNHVGSGFADHVSVDPGTTIEEFFKSKFGGDADPNDYTFRVDGRPVTSWRVLDPDNNVQILPNEGVDAPGIPSCTPLEDGQRVSVSPKGLAGAGA